MTANMMIETPMPTQNEDKHPDARFWDRMARKYAKSKIGDMPGYENTLARTRDFLSHEHDVLEIGCGTGTTALHHAPLVEHITGTDVSSEMVAIANERTADTNLLNAEFVTAAADDLPFAPERFDVVMGHNLYHLVSDLDGSLRAAHRVLKKDGVFITKTPCLAAMNPLLRYGMLPIMKLFYRVPFLGVFTTKQLQNAIIKAGFEIAKIEYHGTKGKDIRPFIVARKV